MSSKLMHFSRTTAFAVSGVPSKNEEPQKIALRGRNARMDALTQRVAKDPKFAFENVCSTMERAVGKVKA